MAGSRGGSPKRKSRNASQAAQSPNSESGSRAPSPSKSRKLPQRYRKKKDTSPTTPETPTAHVRSLSPKKRRSPSPPTDADRQTSFNDDKTTLTKRTGKEGTSDRLVMTASDTAATAPRQPASSGAFAYIASAANSVSGLLRRSVNSLRGISATTDDSRDPNNTVKLRQQNIEIPRPPSDDTATLMDDDPDEGLKELLTNHTAGGFPLSNHHSQAYSPVPPDDDATAVLLENIPNEFKEAFEDLHKKVNAVDPETGIEIPKSNAAKKEQSGQDANSFKSKLVEFCKKAGWFIPSFLVAVPSAVNALAGASDSKPEDLGSEWLMKLKEDTLPLIYTFASFLSSLAINTVMNLEFLPAALQKFIEGLKDIKKQFGNFIGSNIGGLCSALIAFALGLSGFYLLGFTMMTIFAGFNSIAGYTTRFVAVKKIFLKLYNLFNKDIQTQKEAIDKLNHLKEEHFNQLIEVLDEMLKEKDKVVIKAIKNKLNEQIEQLPNSNPIHAHIGQIKYLLERNEAISRSIVDIHEFLSNENSIPEKTRNTLIDQLNSIYNDSVSKPDQVFMEAAFVKIMKLIYIIEEEIPGAINGRTVLDHLERYLGIPFDLFLATVFFLSAFPAFGQKAVDALQFLAKFISGSELTLGLGAYPISLAAVFSSGFYSIAGLDGRLTLTRIVKDHAENPKACEIVTSVAKAAGILGANYLASNGPANIASNVANNSSNIWGFQPVGESTTSRVFVALNRLAGGTVNTLASLRYVFPGNPVDTKHPTVKTIGKFFADPNEHPISSSTAAQIRAKQARARMLQGNKTQDEESAGANLVRSTSRAMALNVI